MARLYLIPLPDAQAQSSDEAIRAAIQSAGLIEEGGTATQKISVDDIDLTIEGQFRQGTRFAPKLADELESLGESAYEGLSVYDPNADDNGRNKGFYDLESVDVSPAHNTARSAFSYTVALKSKETKETAWRAVETNPETINTGLATGSGGLVGIPATAGKVRWFDTANGRENATVQETVDAEFGRVDLYDPTEPSFTSPTLLYEAGYGEQSPVDVRVWDDRDREKYFELDGDGATVSTSTLVGSATVGRTIQTNQWTHVFHSAFEYDGRPVIDNGLIRVRFDEPNGLVRPYRWTGSTWELEPLDHSEYTLIDADIERLGPAQVDVFAEFEDSGGTIETAILSVHRGIDGVIVRDAPNNDVPTDLETMLSPIASDQTSDPQPAQTLKSRGEVK